MTAPASLFFNFPPIAQPFLVLVGPDDGSAVSAEDVDEDVELVSLTRSAGGHKLDHATLVYSLASSQTRIVDKETPFDFSRKVQVRVANPFDVSSLPAAALFSGELAIETAKIDKSGEFTGLVARIEPWHFGDPLPGPVFRDYTADPTSVTSVQVKPHLPIVFNPEIDGKIEPNMAIGWSQTPEPADEEETGDGIIRDPIDPINSHASNLAGADADKAYLVWLDPESARTDPAILIHDQRAALWDLANAVNSLCLAANPDETFVINPTYDDLTTVFEDAPEIRNIHLPRGKRLPELLDELLPRFGYNWFVQCSIDDDGSDDPPCKNYIRIFKLGEGPEVKVFLQRPASPPPALQLTRSNVPDLDIEWNIADVCNDVIGHGSLKEHEATFELYRAWSEEDDNLGPDDLRKTEETTTDDPTEESQYKAKPDVWRKWVLNEAGDYCSTRDTVAPIPDTPFDLKPLLGENTVVKRRRFHHCLTWGADKERRDVFLQYRDTSVANDGDPGAWKAIPHETWTMVEFHVLHKEAGIYFNGATPPPDIMELGKDARLRLTAVLIADERLEYEATNSGPGSLSPNLNTIKLFVDLSDRFHFRQIEKADLGSGDFIIKASALQSETYGDATTDDTQLLTDHVNSLRTLEQSSRISAEFEVFGIQTNYEIGQLVTEVDGRDLSLNRNSALKETKLYPQITGITYDRARQMTKLRVENFDFSPRALRKLSL